MSRRLALALLGTLLGVFAQPVPSISITGAVAKPLTLSAADLKKMPRATVTLKHDNVETVYEGVPIHEILRQAGVPLGPELRGKGLATYVISTSSDGYRVVYSLAELDPGFSDNQVVLADTTGGKPLPPQHGPFRIIAPRDKRASRSARMVTKLEIVQAAK